MATRELQQAPGSQLSEMADRPGLFLARDSNDQGGAAHQARAVIFFALVVRYAVMLAGLFLIHQFTQTVYHIRLAEFAEALAMAQ